MSKILILTASAILCSATALPAQWIYTEGGVDRHPMTDEIIDEEPARASVSLSFHRPERGMIYTSVRCRPSGSAQLEFIFTNLYDGPNLIAVRAGESLRVRFRFDEQPATDWQTWRMNPHGPSLRGARVIPPEGPFSIKALRESREMAVEFQNTRTGESLFLTDEIVPGRTLRGSNAAIGRLPCVR